MDDILCEIVSTNMESCLLGIIFALLTLFEELIEIETDPNASEPSSNAIKHPFWKDRYLA
jgi:hypothetical protein